MPSSLRRPGVSRHSSGDAAGMTADDSRPDRHLSSVPPEPVDDRREDPPPPASAWVEEHAPPQTEAERQALATIRATSRLEEAN